MLQRFLFLALGILVLVSCNTDIDKNITTDLQVEGKEIFHINLGLEDAYYFAFQSLDFYRTVIPDSLPSCPTVTINEAERKVTLTFDKSANCTSGKKLQRSGKIHLQYLNANALESITRLEYEDYEVRKIKIEGRRDFKQVRSLTNPNRRTEEFEDLLFIDEFESSSRLRGNYEFQLTFLNGRLSGFESFGSLEGRNITGRPITMDPLANKRYLVECISGGMVMPIQGSERWQIFRNATSSTNHTLLYENESGCEIKARVNLFDGRVLIFEL
ncbi:hypothetical protein [Cecembia calidifontis]|jgi:hypothetical protein|uniref:Lipoprotein n=1 Tax=Cecembia calidifontis TaxID=1187080 RepID=A0A4Q7PDA2_9BACT|nr:hypothetical protein [Cecembia calidifontis]RZS98344.1 hypothetical protein BC751_3991 [Cecembia calidifontis]